MQSSSPVIHDIVLVGGGHSHVEVIKKFGMQPEPGVRLTLVTRDVHTPYSGMLPGLLAGHYDFDDAHIDLARLCRLTGVRIIHASVNHIDPEKNQVEIEDRPALTYDTLSLDIGSSPNVSTIQAAHHGLPVKPVDEFRSAWARVEKSLVARGAGRVVIAGAGAGGVELTLSLQHRLQQLAKPPEVVFELVSSDPKVLPGHSDGVRRRLVNVLNTRDVVVHRGRRVTSLTETNAVLDDGKEIQSDCTILVTGAAPAAWLADSGLACDERGFVEVDETLRSTSHDNIFAAGDCASVRGHNLPKAGVYAVRQGPVLAENFRARVEGRPLQPYKPQRQILALISTGDRYAIASRGAFTVSGAWVWRWKDYIDRTWMKKYQEFPAMTSDEDDPMRCGGCGAKVPASVLREVIDGLDIPQAPGLVLGVDAPDDAAVIAVPEGKLLVQSVDQFRAFTDDPYLFAKVAANHCLGDLYAMGAQPHSVLAAVTLPYAGSHIIASDLRSVLVGALEVITQAGATLAGGHTAEGAELGFGLTVNGFIDASSMTKKGGANPGEVLILSKAIGTGVVLAADMRGEAKATDVSFTYDSMLQSNQAAAAILHDHGVSACTDVTGFGLAGHLDEMMRAASASAELVLADVPILAGAQALTAAGFQSTLTPANAGEAQRVERQGRGLSDEWQLLFDPQTAGGLLASVPEVQADAALSALIAAGYDASAVIGRVVNGSDPSRIVVV